MSGAAPSSLPLVSCLMPTADRIELALQAVRYFERQDYPHRELLIVDDGDRPLAEHLPALPASPRIRYLRLPARASLGAKRDLACTFARGAVCAQWDDDDWYGARRLSVQVARLLAGDADLCGLEAVFFDLDRWAFWRLSGGLHRRLFAGDVAGGTLVFWRRVWEQLARYPETSLAEDAGFLRRALAAGARLVRIAQPEDGEPCFLYVRHGANTWSFECGAERDPRGWRRASEPVMPAADRSFYARRSSAAPAGALAAGRRPGPLVSCLMPTADRPRFVPQAIRYFLRQDHPERELVIVDDGAEPVAGLVPAHPRIRYLRLPRRRSLGEKRNVACEAAAGEILVHWDDDDWHAPWRLRCQVAHLEAAPADLCGAGRLYFFDPANRRLWLFAPLRRGAPWLAGATLCYRRSLWRRHSFPPLACGEDGDFVRRAARWKSVAELPEADCCVALIHPGNTSPKRPAGRSWRPLEPARAAQLLGADLPFYTALAEPRSPEPR